MTEEKLNEDISQENDEMYEYYKVVTDPGQGPVRIDKFLLDKMNNVSRNRIQKAIKAGAILVDGKEIKSNYKVRPREEIVVLLEHPPEKYDVKPENIPLRIEYEDDDLLVVYKNPGMVVHPGHGNRTGTLVNALSYHFNENLPVMEGNQRDRPGLVHRIDKNTSGLLVIAKTEEAMTGLSKQFFDHSIERTYQALVWGTFDEGEGTIDEYIGRNPRNRRLMHVFEDGDIGKHAITHYKVLEDLYYVSLIECKLETGRTHQIRIHMKHINHPLFNDDMYGGDRVVKGTVFSKYKQFVQNCFNMIPRQALHAKSIGFIHPRTKEIMHFDTDLPEDMQGVLEKWRAYVASRG